MRKARTLPLTILLLTTVAPAITATEMGTAFNYQGYLTKNGKPIDGQNYDLKFDLYDVATGGSPRVSVTNAPVAVNTGLFTTAIDFGDIFNGNAYWLEIGVRNGNQGSYDPQLPRLQIRPVPYALFASNAATAATATTANGVSDNSVTATKIAAGQVVKSLNGLKDNVSLLEGANITLTPNVNNNTLTIASSGGSAGWSLTGNAGTTPGVNFVGTTDNQPLELKVNNQRGLLLERASAFGNVSINVIGGYMANKATGVGATIAGGGYHDFSDKVNEVNAFMGTIGGGAENSVGNKYGTIPGGSRNEVTGAFGTIGGGTENSVSGLYGTIPGGAYNSATASGSFAAGVNAHATHEGAFVWGDGTQGAYSTGPHRFEVLATGGATFYTGGSNLRADSPFLTVKGPGGEEAYFGGNGTGAIALGSLNPAVTEVYVWNPARNSLMNLFARDTSVRTLTITGGADLAEPFQVSQNEIPKGSVVVIDPENPGKLKLSTEAYDTRVAGVVSGAGGVRPGIQMSQEGVLEGTENVALTGRVFVLTDASCGAIHPGDLLTTSATPGHAMKAGDPARAQGAILGKAMSALADGKGMVLVLVTLQ